MTTGLRFTTQAPRVTIDPNRSDVACFVGFVGRRRSPVPEAIRQWLQDQGWQRGPYARSGARDGDLSLLDVPVPIDSWAVFNQLFAPDDRLVSTQSVRKGSTYLGAAVRSFFVQGGRRCYVVRMGDPWPMATERSERLPLVSTLLSADAAGSFAAQPSDRTSWHGLAHLFGLTDVSFLCLPDLCDAIANDPIPLSGSQPPVRKAPERFVTCSAPQADSPADHSLRAIPAPRCGVEGYQAWARALNLVANVLEQQRHQLSLRPIQLVAAVPLPQIETLSNDNLLRFLEGPEALFALSRLPEDRSSAGLVSRVVQLVYPWMRSLGAVALPEQLESPEGTLLGMLARNALVQGTYRSAATLPLSDVVELVPALTRSQQSQPSPQNNKALIERVSLFGPTPSGLQLLSDVTTSLSEPVRPASVHRLIGVILRAAQRLGETLVFEASGPLLWSRLTESLRGLMESLFDAGALRGRSANEAFSVRCDRTTMTQNDIDNGRVIARLEFAPALPVERITVTLTLFDNPQSQLLPALITSRITSLEAVA
ncbi:hypothetical protein [Leptothoe sp. PORK10 BA2]|uniref:hypothetical protein n=1 Tax=Leptothoe sp. PORK10 BA2 TaxID=3110254 RepID=UPI002B1ED2D5|nr:hypothetical protein [Leptothoe sp. PORK10 BA2]MEA5463916.1 hypothetical protein [Leptothoe sp. PORK10 BA2]